ncbi:hypothetical protein Aph01nite_81080 [Acrocarpospora phusangensis]|uniref:HTH cro/C1-type domain-containing protein n=1 Tax=Acrocarpospora phusangensis TaxID=1070424 RepID=A0A919QJ86_9ACTN|nr:helix-turn-helix transcriptional regulator [Acrocarpospora phusangensis]GIH29798.1 hypothetical protein Aph01nite_81080 [Acrocarpospora phusangensis]
MSTPPPSRYTREQLSVLLRVLRSDVGLSTAEAAKRAGFSQSKLSKIETGALLLSYKDGDALCRVYGASAEQREELLDLLRVLHEDVESARVILHRGAHRKQREIARIEAETTHYRDLQVAYVSGLLQTADYIRRMASTAMSAPDRDRHVAARLERQLVLGNTDKRFSFVMSEGALRWMAGPPLLMAAQVDHIIEVSHRPNVDLGVIPWGREIPPGLMPGHEVHIYDDRMVIVGILTATATIQDPRDVEMYLSQFEAVRAVALADDLARQRLDQISAEYRSLG